MNLLVVIFAILMIWRVWKGFKSGFAKEINRVVSLFMALVVLSIVFLLLASLWGKNVKTIAFSVVLLFAASILYRILHMVMKSIETLARLPIIRMGDRLLGGVAGVLEVLIVFWIMYAVVEGFPTGGFGEWVMEWTRGSTLLVNIYKRNYIANWIVGLGL